MSLSNHFITFKQLKFQFALKSTVSQKCHEVGDLAAGVAGMDLAGAAEALGGSTSATAKGKPPPNAAAAKEIAPRSPFVTETGGESV